MTNLTLFDPSFRRVFSDPFFGPFFGPSNPSRDAGRGCAETPAVDIRSTDSEVVIETDLPGVPRENISIRFHDGRLTVAGRRDEVIETPKASEGGSTPAWTHRERYATSFQRAFEVPDSVDASKIRAESKDGVLTIVLPKLEQAQPRQIEVSVS